ADGDALVFERDSGGSEATQIFRLDVARGAETQLTAAGFRHQLGPIARAGDAVAITSVPLDRTAAGGARGEIATELALLDPRRGTRRLIATLPGTGWFPTDFGPGDRTLLAVRFRTWTDAEIWSIDVASGARTRLLPRAGAPAAGYTDARFAADGRLFIVSDHAGEFRALYRYDAATGRFDAVTNEVPWDVELGVSFARDRSRLALVTNEAGRGVLRVYDAATLAPLALPPIPGSVRAARISPDGSRVAVTVVSPASPGAVAVIDLATRRLTWWAQADTAGLDAARFAPAEVIEWPSFDGRAISGLITRPPARFTGRRPVLIDIHGGPEAQARIGFAGRDNYLVNELGIAIIEPNVRGSTGFGKSFMKLDDGRRREDAVRDIGALLDWIGRQPDLDATRVAVAGGSYGGYMAYAAAVHYSDRIRAAISAVGISHFVTFLERTESYRRDLRRVEYGDERDPAMREFLHRISPLTNADKIKVPLFVLHGRNDPRVPVTEAEQIARTVAASGVPVWSLVADNEGHGFAKKENADYAFYARVLFLRRYLLGQG
ncbi:MAG TPA: prolyl oligopeptidase family serine peptidase, partial [Burkholderiaceae bacterium]|nr:prolyl oligopeptidase family serine peptidase [Burkholderiaceae bacterium]